MGVLRHYSSRLGINDLRPFEFPTPKRVAALAQAEPLYKRALAIYEEALGPNHPDVATSLENLAALYRASNRGEEAETLEKRAARIRAIQR